jgi:hypothetical protein
MNINYSYLDKINFEKYNNIFTHDKYNSKTEFFDKPGKQHYRLLAYLSTLFNNSIILDIGTHRGSSATALSYNETNMIYTFDIVNNVTNENIKNIKNIEYKYDNLFEQEGQDKWKNTILKSPLIFLDVDPHNGFMEIDFYNYLININYTGIVICDDIWYFKEMRDNFWYKIPHNYRTDLTQFGHWSGTGMIDFSKLKDLKVNMSVYDGPNSNWTLVTAYFNLAKCSDASVEIKKRDQNYYMHHAVATLSLPYNLIIYCDEDSYDLIEKMRPSYLRKKTHIIICEFDNFQFSKNGVKLNETFADYRTKIINNRKEKPYMFDNRNTASYYLFCMSRYAMLKKCIEMNLFNSTHFAWINICIERMGYKNLIHLNDALSVNRDKFSTVYIDYIPESLVDDVATYFKWGRCSMCSGFFTGNAEYMYKVCDLIQDKFLEYLELGYGHADEQLYSPVYFKNKELFEHYYGDYCSMICNYEYAYDNPTGIINIFMESAYEYVNYDKCFDVCEYVLKSLNLNKILIQDIPYIDMITCIIITYYYANNKKMSENFITFFKNNINNDVIIDTLLLNVENLNYYENKNSILELIKNKK